MSRAHGGGGREDADSIAAALVGALILAKVVLVMEHVPVTGGLRQRAAWLVAVERTVLYGLGVVVVLLIEKAIEVRHEQDWILNVLTVIRRHLGDSDLLKMFMAPLPPAREGN